ncbi:bifunctional DNA-formamidopyrimidine glycosylase/DNA-(apurinic or apyrimidinic site) lyase [Brevibacillus fulvus]|uniref:Formamidopyrimidine-DNA glycosylase n=1 Tax=Brevibacillus fulvus TaxID=1125967 RepID=A0A939BV31_9BACL|nr:bifunctional DNA-formamidopyrimidine glycosylase/DNA-(apurinic or apyrimidinic site) lyase [Brevibacillus fulvus]MBM7590236.1 formamidopyrimidine-DNA glycosylase [Brevibacillus fulvus]
MPELPEMETYRTLLQQRIVGQTIDMVEVERAKTINLPADDFIRTIRGCIVTKMERRAKYLLFHLSFGHVLLLHLMLGGFLYYGSEQDRLNRTAQVVLGFADKRLYFHGLRLGYLHLHSEQTVAAELADLGPEPLDAAFTLADFRQVLHKHRGMLKPVLVDQHVIAGIGNCYSDEICFQTGLLPKRRIDTITDSELTGLYESIRTVLPAAISAGGYMEYPLFQGDKLTGGYNDRCLVYDREGQPCLRCGGKIIKDNIGSRKTFYCAQCQK